MLKRLRGSGCQPLSRRARVAMKEIPPTQGQRALVDDHWYDRWSSLKWQAARDHNRDRFYAVHSRRGQPNLIMHRVIMGASDGQMIDHANHNSLDNRTCNLRICTNGQNQANQKSKKGYSSKFKGVSWCRSAKKWYASIKHQGKGRNLGFFDNEIDAAFAYDSAALRLHGEFARINFSSSAN